jgi:hypothetical protein
MAISCRAFTDFLARKSEHLDEQIIRAMHPIDTWIGHVSTGRFPAEDGVEHTFDRFENVFPNLQHAWEDVTSASCVGTPCDPSSQKIGLGFTRDSYKLQRKAYETDLFCFDQILSADRAKQQFAHVIKTLRRCSNIITSHRLKTEALRIARYKWAAAGNGLTATTATWNAAMTELTVSVLPTSKLTARHLQRRVQPQIRNGAMRSETNHGTQPMLEYVTAMDEIWNLVEGNSELSDHWRFSDFGTAAADFYKYGWTGKLGNYGLRDDSYSLRFNIKSTDGLGGGVLEVVYPYENVAATEGIKEEVNTDYDVAPVQLDFIWHRMAMTSLVRDTTVINPEMPFAARDFAGKWQFVMDNLTCGCANATDCTTDALIEIPIPVNNERRNKGKFIADFSFATKAEYPELAEAMFVLREEACIIDVPRCAADPGYPEQHYDSENDPCPTDETAVLTFLPVLNQAGGTYEIPANTILCNGMAIFHDAITGTSDLDALVAQMNALLSAMGTWANATPNITLTGAACTSVNLPWTEIE